MTLAYASNHTCTAINAQTLTTSSAIFTTANGRSFTIAGVFVRYCARSAAQKQN
jgi:hypothetical protein